MHLGRRGPGTSARPEVAWSQMRVSVSAKQRDPIAPPLSEHHTYLIYSKSLERLQCTILITFCNRLLSLLTLLVLDEKMRLYTLRRRAPLVDPHRHDSV